MQNLSNSSKNLFKNRALRLVLGLAVLITVIYTVSVTWWPGGTFVNAMRAPYGLVATRTSEVEKVIADIEERKSDQEVEKSNVKEKANQQELQRSNIKEEAKQKDVEKSNVKEKAKQQDVEKSNVKEKANQQDVEKSYVKEEAKQQDVEKSDIKEEAKQQNVEKGDVDKEMAVVEKLQPPPVHTPPLCVRFGGVRFDQANPIAVWVTGTEIHEAVNVKIDRQLLLNLSMEYVRKNKDFTLKPWQIKTLPEFKSQCWAEVEGVRCLPAFYLSGMMKCGTTDLWYHIIKHPQILDQYDNKEPLWWGQNRIRSDRSTLSDGGVEFTSKTHKYYKITMEEYTNNFGSGKRATDPNLMMGDASGTTMWLNQVMRDFIKLSEWSEQPGEQLRKALNELRIQPAYLAYQFTPNAKFMVILRNPGDRMYSQFLFGYYLHQHGDEKPTPAGFHNSVLSSIGQYRKCLVEGKGIRFCTYDRIGAALPLGFYVVFITDLLRLVPRENLLVLNFDEYSNDREVTLRRVFQFLGIAHDEKVMSSLKDGKVANSRKNHKTDIGPMWNKTRQLLSDVYRPFNQELAKLLNDDKFLFV